MKCIFCHPEAINIIIENSEAYAIYDKYPVNQGHMLIIPKRHVASFFELNDKEVVAIYNLLAKARKKLEKEYNPDGYNIGINNGQAAGQTIMHLHVHLIPRYEGDVEDPRGGIRHLKDELVPYKG